MNRDILEKTLPITKTKNREHFYIPNYHPKTWEKLLSEATFGHSKTRFSLSDLDLQTDRVLEILHIASKKRQTKVFHSSFEKYNFRRSEILFTSHLEILDGGPGRTSSSLCRNCESLLFLFILKTNNVCLRCWELCLAGRPLPSLSRRTPAAVLSPAPAGQPFMRRMMKNCLSCFENQS